MTTLILASASPRRRELIQLLGLPYEIMTADVDESSVTHPDPAINVVETARLKADAVAARLSRQDAIIVAADTTVAIEGEMLNKPADAAEAGRMLRRLRGRAHQVHTGIVLRHMGTGAVVTDMASVDVPMRNYSDAEIAAYVATGDPLDKAGAYAIQHAGFAPVAHLADCYAAVVGLPLCHLARALRRLGGIDLPHVPARCQQHHRYDCPVHARILPHRQLPGENG